MRIWLVSRDGHPRALFSTASGAADYVADNRGAMNLDVQCLELDAWTRSQRVFSMLGRNGTASSPARP